MTTKFQTAHTDDKDSFQAGRSIAEKTKAKLGEDPHFCLLFCSSDYDYGEVIRGVKEIIGDTQLIGCSTSGEFNEEAVGYDGVSISLISSDTHKFSSTLVTGLKQDFEKCINGAKEQLPEELEGYPYQSAILLIDGLAGVGEEATTAAMNALGPNVKLVGGAAADNLKFGKTYVFKDEMVENNAVVLAKIHSKKRVSIGVKHGHEPITDALTVTKSEMNVLIEVDSRPAFDVWLEKVGHKAHEAGLDIEKLKRKDPEEVKKMFLRFEFGIFTGDGYKVRWPIGVNDDLSVNFACSIPEGSVIKIMEGTKQSQIESAKKAALIATGHLSGEPAGAIIFDCGVRGVILGEEYSKAIDAIKEVINVPLVGFETYGEIALEMGQLSGFHNTTTAILLLPD